jgi:hypothetical protein
MEAKKLVTLTFAKNVGTSDRIFRLLSGAALAAAGWALALPKAAAIGMTAFGLLWCVTGVAARCSVYYLLGYSTCPLSRRPFPDRT